MWHIHGIIGFVAQLDGSGSSLSAAFGGGGPGEEKEGGGGVAIEEGSQSLESASEMHGSIQLRLLCTPAPSNFEMSRRDHLPRGKLHIASPLGMAMKGRLGAGEC